MNMTKWMHAAVFSALIAMAVSPARAESVDEVREARADAVIEFSGVSGEFRVVGGDVEELRVTGTLSDRVDRLRIEGDPSRWRIELEMKDASGRWAWNSGADTRLEITVPQGADLTVRAVSAELSIRGLRGPRLDARTVSGDLTLADNSPARLMAESVSGEVAIDGGGLESSALKSVSGDIDATGLAGRVRAASVSGEVSVDAVELSEFNSETVSGDIEATLRPQNTATIDLQTHSGSINLALPSGTPLDLDGETFSGDLGSSFDADIENVREKGLTLRSGDGSVRVRVQTFSGDFDLRSSGG